MPPIPLSVTEYDDFTISDSIDQSTIDLILAIKRLQNDIITVQLPRLRSIVTDNASQVDLVTQQRDAAEIREDMGKLSRQVEVCQTHESFWGKAKVHGHYFRI